MRIKYNLLGTNAKLEKQQGKRYLLAGLTLAPHTIGGVDVCESKTPSCVRSCVLWYTGRTVTQSVRAAMTRRKRLLFEAPEEFYRLLRADLDKHIAQAKRLRLRPAVRLNVASDLDWSGFVADYPEVRFYDYTKVKSRLYRSDWPQHYDLTYSMSERSHWRTARAQLDRGGNVAAVFSTRYHPQSGRIDPLPDSWTIGGRSYPVVDGDQHDIRLRELDGAGRIIGLRFKGSLERRAKAIAGGFCYEVN